MRFAGLSPLTFDTLSRAFDPPSLRRERETRDERGDYQPHHSSFPQSQAIGPF
jgi:hypothetical protein